MAWQRAAFGAYYAMLAAGAEVPDSFDRFLKKYYPEWRDPEMAERDAAEKANRATLAERARREADEIVQLDRKRREKRREAGLEV